MKIGFMTLALRPPVTGVGRYTLNLAHHLADELGQELLLFAMQGNHGLEPLKDRCVLAPFVTRTGVQRLLWEQGIVPAQVARRGIGVYHSPHYVLPLALTCPSILTVHDLSFRDRRFFNRRMYIYLNVLAPIAIRRAGRIIAVSHHTRRQIERHFPWAAAKTRVVYEAAESRFTTPPTRAEATTWAREKGLGPYILFAGNVEPRKNLPRLLKAFEIAVREADLPHELVICGPLAWRYEPMLAAWRDSPIRHRVRFVGYVPDEEMPYWYAAADALAFPSISEGFGLPALEAMSCGTAVVTSDCSALPEVVGDAAVTVTPTSVESIADGLVKVLSSRTVREELACLGRARASRFSWPIAARETIGVYREVLG